MDIKDKRFKCRFCAHSNEGYWLGGLAKCDFLSDRKTFKKFLFQTAVFPQYRNIRVGLFGWKTKRIDTWDGFAQDIHVSEDFACTNFKFSKRRYNTYVKEVNKKAGL